MNTKPTYEELQNRVQDLEQQIQARQKREEKLLTLEKRFREIVETMGEGLGVADENYVFTFVNESFCKMLGHSRDEMIGHELMEFVAEGYREKFAGQIEKRKLGKSDQYEMVWAGKDGRRIWTLASARPLIGPDGRFRGSYGVLTDITARKAAEKELKESEEKFRTLTDQSPNMIFINRKGKVVYVNRRCEELMGYTREEFLSPDFDFFSMIAPQSLNIVKANFAKHMTGEDIEPYEYALIAKDSKELQAIITTKLITYEGDTAILGIITDITERKKAEKALRKSEERYRELVQNANSIIVRMDTQGTITFFNEYAQDFFGYSEEEILGKNLVGTFVPKTDSSGRDLASMIRDLLADPDKYASNDNENMKKNNERVWIAWTNKAIRNENGDVTEILCVGNDITDVKRLERQLQRAQKLEAVGTLAGGIAHDFNNLLMGIQGNTSLLLLDKSTSHSDYDRLRNIEQYVRNGTELTKQLLGFSRGGKYEVKPTDLNKVLIKTTEMFGRTKKEIRIHSKLKGDLMPVEVDQGQIEQVLLNIYVNAWQAMSGGGDIYLETEIVELSQDFTDPHEVRPGKFARISITDTGVGMDRTTQQRIFDPFFTTKEIGRGTGLGMASAYGIIKNHGGLITVHSNKGEGSTFHIYLPASDKDPIKEKVFAEELIKGSGCILLVDDEAMIIDVGKNMLKELGYEVLVARSGPQALEVYEAHRENIELIILDMIMPDMGGGETFDQLKAIDAGSKVLLSSGYSIDSDAKKILDRGCDGFMQKPFDMKELSTKIRDILESP